MAYNYDLELAKLASKAKQMYFEGESSSISAFYGPYESLTDAMDYFTTVVSLIFRTIPAGYKVGIKENGEIKQEYIYIGGTIIADHFVPIVMDGDYASLKTKVAGIAIGAEANLNAFSNVKIGNTTIAADTKTDTLTLVAGNNVTLTPDATTDKVTIAATDTTYSNATTSAAGLMSATDKALVDQLIPVVEAGGWNVDSNFQVGGSAVVSGGSTIPANLEARLTRIEAVLGDLYDDEDATGASDGQFVISE